MVNCSELKKDARNHAKPSIRVLWEEMDDTESCRNKVEERMICKNKCSVFFNLVGEDLYWPGLVMGFYGGDVIRIGGMDANGEVLSDFLGFVFSVVVG